MREILFKAKAKNWRERPKEWWWGEGYYAKMGKDDLVLNGIPGCLRANKPLDSFVHLPGWCPLLHKCDECFGAASGDCKFCER